MLWLVVKTAVAVVVFVAAALVAEVLAEEAFRRKRDRWLRDLDERGE